MLDAQLTRVDGNERELAAKHIEFLSSNPAQRGEKELLLMDRGYPSYEFIRNIERLGIHYAMRFCKAFCKSMPIGDSQDCIIEHRFSKAKAKTRLRVVRFDLGSGNEEIIVTNIFGVNAKPCGICLIR